MQLDGKLGVIGTGAMGQALIQGILAAGKVAPEQILPADMDTDKLEEFTRDLGLLPADNAKVAEEADVIVLAVKPPHMGGVLAEVGPALRSHQLLISIAAGITLGFMEERVPADVPCVRAMPNTPCLVGAGAIALSSGRQATESHGRQAEAIFATLGRTVLVPEAQMDAVTGLSGSGPAYAYLMIEALAGGGVAAGLPRDVAFLLAAQTLAGAARMVLESDLHPAQLKDLVTSPAGTTAAGLAVLEDRGLRGTLQSAVMAAAARSAELGAKAGPAS